MQTPLALGYLLSILMTVKSVSHNFARENLDWITFTFYGGCSHSLTNVIEALAFNSLVNHLLFAT
jgi:hypothetical protein